MREAIGEGKGEGARQREAAREAREGAGEVALVREGRKVKVTGKKREAEAASEETFTEAVGLRGERRWTRIESLIVGPVRQPAARRATAAASRAHESR